MDHRSEGYKHKRSHWLCSLCAGVAVIQRGPLPVCRSLAGGECCNRACQLLTNSNRMGGDGAAKVWHHEWGGMGVHWVRTDDGGQPQGTPATPQRAPAALL
jgi:hypothetical protein